MGDVIFKITLHGSDEYQNAVSLREDILRKPFGLHFTCDELEAEKKHMHIIGLMGNTVVASAVLVPEKAGCKMQRVVVKEALQNTGLGSKMMQFCEDIAKNNRFEYIYCHARDSAVNFYLKNGYHAEGDYFEEDTILHLTMRKRIEFSKTSA